MFDDPAPPVGRREGALALVLAAASIAVLAWTARVPEAGASWRLAFVGVHLLASGALILWLRRRAPTLGLVLLGAVFLRLVALPMAPVLSDDGYRYLWDGAVVLEGISPYAMRPADPALAELPATGLLAQMNSPEYYSVYPPASQAVFAIAAQGSTWRQQWVWLKVLLVGAELLGVWLLLRLCGPRLGALYAWSPLAVIEVAGQGHTEGLVVGGLGLVLWAGRSRWPLASVGVTVAGLTKLYPFALAPAVWRRDGLPGVVVSIVLVAALSSLVWHPQAIAHVQESVALFFGTFDEYAGPYRLLKSVLYPVLGAGAGAAASGLLGVLFAVAVAASWVADDGRVPGLRCVLTVCVVGFAMTASTLHPWYWLPVLWMIPLLESKPLLWLCALSSATYLSYTTGGAGEWATLIGWGGAALLWAREIYARRTSPPTSSTASAVAERASSHDASG
ncbi:hypothetical protein [Rubrivirga sp. IMCC45206]|uniref:hypothetical protein n=1 Tax=Rubrivirga sp. IMCC45206 TaxID=3391614 RepID=UPI00398FA075